MTYAIIRAAGHQYRAEPGKTIRIPSMTVMSGRRSSSPTC
jgi:ribosomal protein L21